MTNLEKADLLIRLTKRDLFGRPLSPLFKGMKMPNPQSIVDVVVHGNREGFGVVEVVAVLKVLCEAANALCPLLGNQVDSSS